MIWKITIMLPIFTIQPLLALVEKRIDEKMPLEVTFSRTSHNRISIENGFVERVFGDGAVFAVSLDKTTGNAFVNVLQNIDDRPVTLTVVSSGGLVQDLIVTSKEKSSEQVLLKEEDDLDFDDSTVTNSEIYHAATVDLLTKILEGKAPLGYGKKPIEAEDSIELPAPLKINPIKAFEGVFETIVVYTIQNEGDLPVVLSAKSLKNEKHAWVFLNIQELKKNDQAICIISQLKN